MPFDTPPPDKPTLDDDLQDALDSRFGEDEENAAGDGESGAESTEAVDEPTDARDGEDTGGEGSAEGASPPDAPADDPLLTDDEIQQWAAFREFLAQNDEARLEIAAVLERAAGGTSHPQQTGGPEGVQPPAAPADEITPPDGLDLDDPQVAALWNQHVQTLTTVQRLEEGLARHEQFLTQQQQQSTNALLSEARTAYQKENELSDAEMQQVYDETGRLQVLPAFLSPVDPATGIPRAVDPISAMKQAFDVGRWNIPGLREKALRLAVDEKKAGDTKKRKLSSLAGSSGSTPRTPETVPTDPHERRLAMVNEVARMLQGEGASE